MGYFGYFYLKPIHSIKMITPPPMSPVEQSPAPAIQYVNFRRLDVAHILPHLNRQLFPSSPSPIRPRPNQIVIHKNINRKDV
jgi:hypothetical protein